MPTYTVRVARTEYKYYDFEVEAENRDTAETLAEDKEISDAEWEIGNADEAIVSVNLKE